MIHDSRIGVRKPVSHPRFGEDVLRRRGVLLDLPAERGAEHSEELGLIDDVRTPDGFENGTVCEHASRMLREVREQLEFLWRQADFVAVSEHPESLSIDEQPTSHDRLAG